MSKQPFRAIIVGGGPVGLMAAHALAKANIDFIVLERRASIVDDTGASIIVYQGTLRVLSQLGLLESLKSTAVEFSTVDMRALSDDRQYGREMLKESRENFGAYGQIIHRAHLLQVLYDGFSDADKARIFTDRKVQDIISTDAGVEVHCADGVTYEGSIVIGADGVSSLTRKAIRSLALKSPDEPKVDEENPFVSTYRMLWFSAPRPDSFEPGSGCASYGKDVSAQTLNGHDLCWVFLYERLPEPKKDRVYYSEKDMYAFVDKWSHLIVYDDVQLGEIFSSRYRAGVTNLEEGVLNHWSQGRIVLVGDSAHKFTPNAGLGFNNGVQDVTVLTNELHQLLDSNSDPPVTGLTEVFQRYHENRVEVLMKDYESSVLATRVQAWENTIYWFMDRYLVRYLPVLQRFFLNYGVNDRLRKQRVLEFLPGDEPFRGKIPWDFPIGESPRHSR